MVHYVLRHGLLPIGIAVIVGGNVSRWLHNQPTLFSGVLSDQEIANLLWIAVAGIAFGFVKWNLNQRKYRNIVSKGVS